MSKAEELCIIRDSRFSKGVHEFNSHNWYSAHDIFEELWHEASGDSREILHGLIQVSVAEYHLDNQNLRGAILLMAEGVNHLESGIRIDLDYDLRDLLNVMRKRLSCLQSCGDLSSCNQPMLHAITR